jgi:RHS repeat-associated protein
VEFLWDGDVLCEERDSSKEAGTEKRVHVHEPGTFVPMLQVERGEAFVVVNDHLGMPKELIDSAGRVAWRATHGAWGDVRGVERDRGAAEVESPFRLLGQYADGETGLCYTRFRYFEAATGRWLSADPLGIIGGRNLHAFNGGPTTETDPLGLTCVKDTNGGKGYIVYHILENGKVVYVGITEADRFEDRQKEHQRSGRLQPGMEMERADKAATYGEARGFEQAHIEFFGTRDTGARGTPLSEDPSNRCWSWDPARANDPSDSRAQSFNAAYQKKADSLWGTVVAH